MKKKLLIVGAVFLAILFVFVGIFMADWKTSQACHEDPTPTNRCPTPTPKPTPVPPVVTPEPPVVTPEPPVVTPEPPVVTPEPPVVTPEPNKGLCIHWAELSSFDGKPDFNSLRYHKNVKLGDIIDIDDLTDWNKVLGLPEGTLVLDEKSCQHFPLTVSAINEDNYIDLQYINTTGVDIKITPRANVPVICVLYAFFPYDEDERLLIDNIEEVYSSPGYKLKSLKIFEEFQYPEDFSSRIVMANSELNPVPVIKTN